MVDLFISYSRANRDMVQRLAEAVSALGYVVWWDEELPAHLSYGDVITAKIGEAKATLVVWSRTSAASEWVRAEADLARNQKKLIQAVIDECTPPLPFNQIQFAALGDWSGDQNHPGWRKVRASLAALCGPAPAEAGASIVIPVAKAPPAPRYQPPRRLKSRSRASRVAVVTIAASLAVILTVGSLVVLKGPPVVQAKAAEAPAPAPAPAPVQAPAKPDAAPDQPVDDSGDVDTTDAGGPQDDVQANQAAGY